MWNDQPVSGADVEIGTGITIVIGGETRLHEPVYKTATDAEGYYLFADVEPGKYVRRVKAFGTWFYPEGHYVYRAFTVNAGQTIDKDTYHVVKSDMILVAPADAAAVAYDKLTLTWEAYADAQHYEVKLAPEGKSAFEIEPTTTTSYTHPQPLLNGNYTWAISAYNENGRAIAESPERNLTITGAAYSIYVEVVSPDDKATVSGTGLTLEWQPYPGASYYKVYVAVSGGEAVVMFVKVTDGSYMVPQALKPATYYWTVTAYDSSDKELAKSSSHYFTVE